MAILERTDSSLSTTLDGVPVIEQLFSNNTEQKDLAFLVYKVGNDGTVTSYPQHVDVEKRLEGGFFGEVIFIENKNYIIKTTEPKSNLRKSLRYLNWGLKEFPSQKNETAIMLDYLSVNLKHDIIPVISQGKFSTPQAHGYTQIDGNYALLLDKVKGRGPRFNTSPSEYPKFKQDQTEASDLLYDLGFMEGSQIDPDSPLGLANFWWTLDDDPRNTEDHHHGIIVNNLTAFQLKPTLGFIRFGFHQKAKNQVLGFDSKEIPFNQVNTAKLRQKLAQNQDKFIPEEYQRIVASITLYEQKRDEFKQSYQPKTVFAEAAKTAALLSGEITVGTAKQVLQKPLSVSKGALTFIVPNWQKGLLLSGMRAGHKENLVSDQELEEGTNAVHQSIDDRFYATPLMKSLILGGNYFALSRGVNMIEAPIYIQMGLNADKTKQMIDLSYYQSLAFTSDIDLLAKVVATGIGFRLASALFLRYPATHLLGKALNLDYSEAKKVCWIPWIGDQLGVAAQANKDLKLSSPLVGHYAIRNLIANCSKYAFIDFEKKEFTLGGWGTDSEAKIMHKAGPFLERALEDEDFFRLDKKLVQKVRSKLSNRSAHRQINTVSEQLENSS